MNFFGCCVLMVAGAGVASNAVAAEQRADAETTALAPGARPRATDREAQAEKPSVEPVAAHEAQRLSFVENAYGSSRGVVFAGVSSLAISSSEERAQLGVLFGGSPLPRLTLHGLVGRDGKGHFAPWLAAQYTFVGGGHEHHALGALLQYKTEGFTEAGGELELGALFSLRPGRLRLDVATLFGIGLEEEEAAMRAAGEEEGEADAEGKLRLGYQVLASVQVGIVGRFRQRVIGERSLAGGKSWDFIGGGEVVASLGPCAIAASGGPTTLGVADGVGAYGMLSVALFSAL